MTLLFFMLSCTRLQEKTISKSASEEQRCQGTVQELMAIANALPNGAKIRLPIAIQQLNPLGGIQATIGSQSLQIHDMTSMGIPQVASFKAGQSLWMDGQWGAVIDLPIPDERPSFSVTAVGEVVPPNTPLTLIRLDGPLSCTKP